MAPTCNFLETDLRTLPHLNPCKTDFTYFQDSRCNAARYSVDKYRIYRVVGVPTCMPTVLTGLEIEKKNSSRLLGTSYQRKNGRQMPKCSRQIVQEQKLRLEPHLIGVVVRLLELNTLQKHPPVAAA